MRGAEPPEQRVEMSEHLVAAPRTIQVGSRVAPRAVQFSSGTRASPERGDLSAAQFASSCPPGFLGSRPDKAAPKPKAALLPGESKCLELRSKNNDKTLIYINFTSKYIYVRIYIIF